MMEGHMSALVCCIDFSDDEIRDAQAILNDNMHAFFRMDDVGYKIRDCAIQRWEKQLVEDGQYAKDDFASNEQKMIIADLQNDCDVKNAIVMNEQYQRTKNGDGL